MGKKKAKKASKEAGTSNGDALDNDAATPTEVGRAHRSLLALSTSAVGVHGHYTVQRAHVDDALPQLSPVTNWWAFPFPKIHSASRHQPWAEDGSLLIGELMVAFAQHPLSDETSADEHAGLDDVRSER